jgi:hypothetical protein
MWLIGLQFPEALLIQLLIFPGANRGLTSKLEAIHLENDVSCSLIAFITLHLHCTNWLILVLRCRTAFKNEDIAKLGKRVEGSHVSPL